MTPQPQPRHSSKTEAGRKSLHIRPLASRDHVPIPVTFYLPPEIFADAEAAPADYLADLMKGDLAFAIDYFRKQEDSADA